MVANVPTIQDSATIADVERLLVKEEGNFAKLNYIYLVNKKRQLAGVISIKEIFRSPKEKKAKSLSPKKYVCVRASTDQERVAYLALKHNIKAIPVVDKNNGFLGVVTSNAIMNIIHAEGTENLFRFGGVIPNNDFDDTLTLPIYVSIKHRLPWLFLGLLGGFLTASVVTSFEEVLKKNLILAAFIPLIVYMSGAVGAQMQAFIIRDMAVNPHIKWVRYFLRQTIIVLIIGVLISLAMYGISEFLHHDGYVSFVLAVALFCAVFSSLITGLIVPFVFGKLRMDPANASGPIATIIQDLLSVLIYLVIASLILL